MLSWIRETGWSFGFNDPSILDGRQRRLFPAAGTSFFLARRAKRRGSLLRRFWLGSAAASLLLGLNKQLDLQTLLSKAASRIAEASGWYGQKDLIRFGFAAAAAVAFLAPRVAVRPEAGFSASQSILWTAIALVLLFILVRTSAFDGVFRAIGFRMDLDWPVHIIELLGVGGLDAALLMEALRERASVGLRPDPERAPARSRRAQTIRERPSFSPI